MIEHLWETNDNQKHNETRFASKVENTANEESFHIFALCLHWNQPSLPTAEVYLTLELKESKEKAASNRGGLTHLYHSTAEREVDGYDRKRIGKNSAKNMNGKKKI